MPPMHFAENGSVERGPDESSSAADEDNYSVAEKEYLLAMVHKVIGAGLEGHQPVAESNVDGNQYPGLLQQRSCFVTLKIDGQLRGCIGNLEVNSRLIDAVARNAYLAAFKDHRFSPVNRNEAEQLEVEISVLTPIQPLPVISNEDLLQKLRPGVDGLIFKAGECQATFLPAVWQQLPDTKSFVEHLKQKAGLSADFWSDDVDCKIYQAIKVSEESLE